MPDPYLDQSTPTAPGYDASTQPVHQPSPEQNSSKKLLLVVASLLILLAGGVTAAVYLTKDKKNVSNNSVRTEVVNVYATADGFVPSNLQIKPNTQVVWTNKDKVMHEVKVTDKNAQPLDIYEKLAPGESFSIVLDEEKDYYVQSPTDGVKFQAVIKVKTR